jgi:hypothetical protein
MSGVFAVSRAVFDHALFAPEPFTEREAWIWMIGEAAWRPCKARAGKALISLDRGQLAHSVRFMADKWQWSKSRVDRFLDRLKTEAMIGTDAGQGLTVITICKYDEYQKVSLPKKPESGTDSGTTAGQQRDREESTESIEGKKEPLRGASPEAELFAFGRKVLGKSAGGLVTQLRKASDFDDAQVKALIEEAATKGDPAEWIGGVLKRHKAEGYGLPVVAPNVPRIKTREDREWQEAETLIYRNVL